MSEHPIEEIPGYSGKTGIVGHTGNQTAEVDRYGHLVSIDTLHNAIHNGLVFTECLRDESLTTATKWWLLMPNEEGSIHTTIDIGCTVSGFINLYEGVNVGTFSKGTLGTFINHNRNAHGTLNCFVYDNPRGFTGTGIELFTQRIGAGGSQRLGGDINLRDEWMLKPKGTYAVSFVPDANSGKISVVVKMYERGVL